MINLRNFKAMIEVPVTEDFSSSSGLQSFISWETLKEMIEGIPGNNGIPVTGFVLSADGVIICKKYK